MNELNKVEKSSRSSRIISEMNRPIVDRLFTQVATKRWKERERNKNHYFETSQLERARDVMRVKGEMPTSS